MVLRSSLRVLLVGFVLMVAVAGAYGEEASDIVLSDLDELIVDFEQKLDEAVVHLHGLQNHLEELYRLRAALENVTSAREMLVYAVPKEGLLAEYLFFGNFADTSGHAMDATAQYVEFASNRDGRPHSAALLDGTQGSLDTGIPLDMSEESGGYTMTAWVYPRTDVGRRQVFSADDGGYDWSLLQDGRTWSVFNGWTVLNTELSVDVDEWQFLAVVFDPKAGIRVHKDEETWSTDQIAQATSRYTLQIGANPGFGEYFHGAIDEVRVYGRPLDESEIEAIRR